MRGGALVADTVRVADPPLIRELLERGPAFSFFQAVRLLQALDPKAPRVGRQGPASLEAVRLRPSLSYAFQNADLERVRRLPGGKFEVVSTFLGLYGTASPLPSYFTEQLFFEQDEEKGFLRGFLDLFHHRLLSLFYRAWEKYRYDAQFTSDGEDPLSTRLSAMLATDAESLPKDHAVPAVRLLAYAGVLTQQPRSAAALNALLSDYFEGLPVAVVPFAGGRTPVPADQRNALGSRNSRLGEDLVVGESVSDPGGAFRVEIGPAGLEDFLSFLPGKPRLAELRELCDLMNDGGLDLEVELELKEDEVPPLRLSDGPARLGWSTWLGRRPGMDTTIRFLLKGWLHGRG
jgi:type VI secretion system protein ImpH